MARIEITDKSGDDAFGEAIAALERGDVVAYPTETFYGLGVRFDRSDSLRRLYELKRRPREKAMPVIIGSEDQLPRLVSSRWLERIPSFVSRLMEAFWPGPLTLLLPSREGLSEHLTAETGMIAVRIPGESFALQLVVRYGLPITATSANPSGLPPAESAEAVRRYFGDGIDVLIDGGKSPGGLPSTIVDCGDDEARIVRQGAVKAGDIFRVLGK